MSVVVSWTVRLVTRTIRVVVGRPDLKSGRSDLASNATDLRIRIPGGPTCCSDVRLGVPDGPTCNSYVRRLQQILLCFIFSQLFSSCNFPLSHVFFLYDSFVPDNTYTQGLRQYKILIK